MSSTKSILVKLVLALLFGSIVYMWYTLPNPKQALPFQPTDAEICRDVFSRMANLQEFSVRVERQVQWGKDHFKGLKLQTYLYDIQIARPDRLKIEPLSLSVGSTFYCDGQLLALVQKPRLKRWELKPPALLENIIKKDLLGYRSYMDLKMIVGIEWLLQADPLRTAKSEFDGKYSVCDAQLGNMQCTVVAIETDTYRLQFWVDKNQGLLRKSICKMSRSSRDFAELGEDWQMTCDFVNWNVSPSRDESAFKLPASMKVNAVTETPPS